MYFYSCQISQCCDHFHFCSSGVTALCQRFDHFSNEIEHTFCLHDLNCGVLFAPFSSDEETPQVLKVPPPYF